MSNFSNHKNDRENGDEQSNCDNTPDFLTALQEARNALDRLFLPIPTEEEKIGSSEGTHFKRQNLFPQLNTTDNILKSNISTDTPKSTKESHQSPTQSKLGSHYNKSNELLQNSKQNICEFSSIQLRNNAVEQSKLPSEVSKERPVISDEKKGIFIRSVGARTSDNCQRKDSCNIHESNSKSGIDLSKVSKKSTTEKLNFLVEDLEVRLKSLLDTNVTVDKDQPVLESTVINLEEIVISKVESFGTREKNAVEIPSSSISNRPSSYEKKRANNNVLINTPRRLEEITTANIINEDCNFELNTFLSLKPKEFNLEQQILPNKNTHVPKYLQTSTSNSCSTGNKEMIKEMGLKEDLKVDIPSKLSENLHETKIAARSTNYILLGDTLKSPSNLLKQNTENIEREKLLENKSIEIKKTSIKNLSQTTVSNSLRRCTEDMINKNDTKVDTPLDLPKYPPSPNDASSFKETKSDVFPNSTPPNSLSLFSGNTQLLLEPTVSLLLQYPQSPVDDISLEEQNPDFLLNSTPQKSLSHPSVITPSPIEPTVSNLEREILLRKDSFENKNNKVLHLPDIPKYPQTADDVISFDKLNPEFLPKSTPHNSPRLLPGSTQSLLEPTMSNLEREILLRGESFETKKTKVLQLPQTSIPNSPSRCEKEMVGDDVARNRAHILCECEVSGMSGNAVPMVTSFTAPNALNLKDNEKLVRNAVHNSASLSKVSSSQADNLLHKPKPSLIPKPTYPHKSSEKANLPGRIPKQSCLVTSDQEISDEEKLHNSKKVSTSLLKKNVNIINENPEYSGKSKADQNEKQQQLRFNNESVERQRRKKLQNEFSRNINRVVEEAVNLRKNNNIHGQSSIIDDLYTHILQLKTISNELSSGQSKDDNETNESQETNDHPQLICDSENKKSRDNNKIHIKFLPTKSSNKKRKFCNVEVQTDFTVSADDLQLNSTTDKRTKHENSLNKVDSMDGMFIPLGEEPMNMKDEEDEEGLDISITFPEFAEENGERTGSHLSVCFSDISAEALGRLKRCPKEFTLHMDFVQGKMFFQSAKTPANNFSIGPNLKIIECNIDEKKSDIISIKPSTECMYNSQIIPVEGARTKSSVKILRSTDSELFNVVSIPTIPNRRTSGNTKSCITFKNRGYANTGSLLSTRRSYKSMPQIPSLTNILEEPISESTSTSRAAAMMNPDKKPKNRTLPKKRTNTSLEKLPEV